MKHLLLIFLFPVFLFSQKPQKYPSLLWKISGNGLKKSSYLYGTMHVSNKLAFNLSEQFFNALENVDVVGLETNPGEWLEGMDQTGELLELNRFRPPILGANFYETAFKPNLADKRMLQGILSYDPDIIDGLLYRQNKQKQNFEVSTYIDLFIFQSAAKLNKKIISLESFGLSQIKSKLASIPDSDAQNNYIDRNIYNQFQKIEDAYREGNLDLLDSLSTQTSSKNNQKYLLEDRNVFFVNSIDSVLKSSTIFAGVGAAHLPGQRGVIELLRNKGYKVEPVFPHITKGSHKRREELDAIFKPVQFQKQYAVDSIFSVQLPGKLYSLVNLENLKYQIHADMVNGSFYTIVRLNYFGPLAHLSPNQIMAKLDSLIFENIPGKIIKHNFLEANNGIKGIEVINQTRNGDLQHYQIYITNMEIILFKLGGKYNYATSNEAKQFFNSINFKKQNIRPVAFTPPTKGFSVVLPANFVYTKNDASSIFGLVEDLYAYDDNLKNYYGVKQVVYNDFNYLEQDTFELNQLARYTLSNYNFTINTSSTITSEQGYPCILFSGKNFNSEYLSAKILIKGVHYYYQYFIGNKANQFETDFMKSFKLSDFEYVNTIKDITDKEFCFKTKDEVSDNALSRFNETLAKAFELAMPKPINKSDYDYRTATKYYYSPSSNEYVNLIFEKYNNYDFRDTSELNKKMQEFINKTTSLYITNKKFGLNKTEFTFECDLKDTATSRVIALKLVYKNGISVELTAPYDSITGMKGWMKAFYDSFSIMDTIVGQDIFKNKFEFLLKDLASKDTTIRQAANNSLRNAISLHKSYIDTYLQFLAQPNLNEINEDSRALLFVNGGTLGSDKIIEPYKKLYKQYTDSFYLQLCLLKGLGCLKTQSSYNNLLNLILNETPLVGNESAIQDVFNVFHDSLTLCKKFFPQLLSLTKYDEYKGPVYTLLADLVNQNLITSTAYVNFKDQILDDANLNLKRFNPNAGKIIGKMNDELSRLDKNEKELAENLKMSLEAYDKNVFYKNLGKEKRYDFLQRNSNIDFAIPLAPFYKTDLKVKSYFDKLKKVKSQQIALPLLITCLKQGINVNDSLLDAYSKSNYTKTYFYSELEKENLTQKFNSKYLSQKALVESLLNSEYQLSKYYNSNGQKIKNDSLIFLEKLSVKNKYQEGELYVYKKPKEKNEPEVWMVVFVPKTNQNVTTNMSLLSSNYFVDASLSQKENLLNLSNYFSVRFRKRSGDYFARFEDAVE